MPSSASAKSSVNDIVPGVLVDAGPLVALFDRRDADHQRCAKAFAGIRDPMQTAWPVVTEAMHLLAGVPGGRDALWELLGNVKAVSVLPLDRNDYPDMQRLMRKYGDQGMDLGDAALVHLAEREHLPIVFTLDRDFQVYRIGRVGRFTLIPD